MAIYRKDKSQIEARIRYCDRAAREQGERNAGDISVIANIDCNGHAGEVTVNQSGAVSERLSSCVRELVQTAKFASERDHARKSSGALAVGAPSKEN